MAKKVIILICLYGCVQPGHTQTWIQSDAPTNLWNTITCSANGKTIIAAGTNANIYISTNCGINWIPNRVADAADTAVWFAVAASYDATHLIAAQRFSLVDSNGAYSGYVYTSTNRGATWQQTSLPQANWAAVASSADGTKLLCVGPAIYISTNTGTTWSKATPPAMAPTTQWTSVSSSGDGTKLAATCYSTSIYTSTNSGLNWTNTDFPGTNWFSITSSTDGNNLAAYSYSLICTSTNAGASWQKRTNIWSNGRGPQTIASSADGTKLAVAAWTRLYTSTNSGSDWQLHLDAPLINNPYAIASSADGSILAVAAFVGPIYVLSNAPPNLITLGISLSKPTSADGLTNYLLLSWPAWATNASLQQNQNLNPNGWSATTNRATLVTNLEAGTTNYLIAVPNNRTQMFYRINTPK